MHFLHKYISYTSQKDIIYINRKLDVTIIWAWKTLIINFSLDASSLQYS